MNIRIPEISIHIFSSFVENNGWRALPKPRISGHFDYKTKG